MKLYKQIRIAALIALWLGLFFNPTLFWISVFVWMATYLHTYSKIEEVFYEEAKEKFAKMMEEKIQQKIDELTRSKDNDEEEKE